MNGWMGVPGQVFRYVHYILDYMLHMHDVSS
jgi:hypothetical protein